MNHTHTRAQTPSALVDAIPVFFPANSIYFKLYITSSTLCVFFFAWYFTPTRFLFSILQTKKCHFSIFGAVPPRSSTISPRAQGGPRHMRRRVCCSSKVRQELHLKKIIFWGLAVAARAAGGCWLLGKRWRYGTEHTNCSFQKRTDLTVLQEGWFDGKKVRTCFLSLSKNWEWSTKDRASTIELLVFYNPQKQVPPLRETQFTSAWSGSMHGIVDNLKVCISWRHGFNHAKMPASSIKKINE